MKKILIATEKKFADIATAGMRECIENADFELKLLQKYNSKEQLIEAVADVHGLIIRSDKVDKDVIEAGKNLEIVVRAGAGFDNVDTVAATAKNIVVMNTPGQNSNAVAELAIGMMIYKARCEFQPGKGFELKGKKLGLHAFGNVGKHLARIAKGLQMEVYAYDPFLTKENIEKEGVKALVSIEHLYQTCQYISLHIPANEKTKKSINYNLLSKMPAGAVLINTARKEIIHEADLLKIMSERNDFVYLTDIMPDCNAELLEKFKAQYFSTPKKMGAETEEANVNAGLAAARQTVNFLKNGDTTFKVN